MKLGDRVRTLRTARRLTLAEIAGDALSVGLLSKLERDLVQPSLETLAYVASRLGVSPAALLLTEVDRAVSRARGTLAAARASLLLGNPAEAAGAAIAALQSPPPLAEPLPCRLFAVAAEASFVAGNVGQATVLVRDASASGHPAWVKPEIAWVLGALERRRGALAEAERTWTSCLDPLEQPRDAHPWWPFLRASVLAELGGLAEARGDLERARNLVARAASIASGVAQAAIPAAALLASWSALSGAPPFETDDEEPPTPQAALALAVTAAAERLSRRLTLEAARLERAAWAPDSRAPAPDIPASRGLRRA